MLLGLRAGLLTSSASQEEWSIRGGPAELIGCMDTGQVQLQVLVPDTLELHETRKAQLARQLANMQSMLEARFSARAGWIMNIHQVIYLKGEKVTQFIE